MKILKRLPPLPVITLCVVIFFFSPLLLMLQPTSISSSTKLNNITGEQEKNRIYPRPLNSTCRRQSLVTVKPGILPAACISRGLVLLAISESLLLLYGAAIEGSSTPESQKILGQFFLTGISTPKITRRQ